MPPAIDISGQKFGRITALKRSKKTIGKVKAWECVCDCGTNMLRTAGSLRHAVKFGGKKGHVGLSCGCLQREKASAACKKRNATHGLSRTCEYKVWAGMKNRCYNKNDLTYQQYGGRGVKVCERWHNFENFIVDMEQRPSKKHTLGRKDNNGDYAPENCRWETTTEQNRNKGDTKKIAFSGKFQSTAEWCREWGISRGCFIGRLRRGWSLFDSLTKPLRQKQKKQVVKTSSEKRPLKMVKCQIRYEVFTNDDLPKFSHTFVDLTNKRLGNLLILKVVGKDIRGGYVWLCKCDCGHYVEVRSSGLTSGTKTRSCGCRQISTAIGERSKTHGMSKSKEYRTWLRMMSRCYKETDSAYEDYGGRGIKVCKKWHKFENFFKDMSTPPSSLHSINRKNNDGSYTPSNCEWATATSQANNRRNNIFLTHNGERKTIAQWHHITGVKRATIEWRMKRGWPSTKVLGDT